MPEKLRGVPALKAQRERALVMLLHAVADSDWSVVSSLSEDLRTIDRCISDLLKAKT